MIEKPALVLCCVLAWPACGSRDNEPAAGTSPKTASEEAKPRPAAKESRMIHVESSEQLLKLRNEYQRMWDSGYDGTLEVDIAAADYSSVGWSLEPIHGTEGAKRKPTIDVVLRGAPARLVAPRRIRARSLRLEGLIITGEFPMIELEVAKEFSMKNCLVINNMGVKNHKGPFLAVRAWGSRTGRPDPVHASIESSWFVRNMEDESPMALIGFGPAQEVPGYFGAVEVRGTSFLNNSYSWTTLNVDSADHVLVDDCLFYKTWPAAGTLLSCMDSDGMKVENSSFVVDSLANLAEVKDCPPVAFEKSRVFVKGWNGSAEIPKTVAITPEMIVARKDFEPGEKVVEEAGKMGVDRMPPADLRKKLEAAFRP